MSPRLSNSRLFLTWHDPADPEEEEGRTELVPDPDNPALSRTSEEVRIPAGRQLMLKREQEDFAAP